MLHAMVHDVLLFVSEEARCGLVKRETKRCQRDNLPPDKSKLVLGMVQMWRSPWKMNRSSAQGDPT